MPWLFFRPNDANHAAPLSIVMCRRRYMSVRPLVYTMTPPDRDSRPTTQARIDKRKTHRRRMVGDTAMVSTLVTVVGQPKTPTLAGKGGFRRGLPWWVVG